MVFLLLGCQRGGDSPVTIVPDATVRPPNVPSDPFGAPGVAYDRLRAITDQARERSWDGNVETLADWLELETQAVEQALALMKTLRVGAPDVYAVANGRVALVYEHIAGTLVEAEPLVRARELEYDDWVGQEAVLFERANAFYSRCARGCRLGGLYLDVWELRCQAGVAETSAKLAATTAPPPPRQPE